MQDKLTEKLTTPVCLGPGDVGNGVNMSTSDEHNTHTHTHFTQKASVSSTSCSGTGLQCLQFMNRSGDKPSGSQPCRTGYFDVQRLHEFCRPLEVAFRALQELKLLRRTTTGLENLLQPGF